MHENGTYVVKKRKASQVLYCIGGIILMVVSIMCIGSAPFWGYLGLLLFGASTIYMCIELVKNKPILVVNNQGIIDNASAMSYGFIPWGDVRDIQSVKQQAQGGTVWYVNVTIKDELLDAYIERSSSVKRLLRGLSSGAGYDGAYIAMTGTGLKADEVVLKMKVFLDDFRRRNDTEVKA